MTMVTFIIIEFLIISVLFSLVRSRKNRDLKRVSRYILQREQQNGETGKDTENIYSRIDRKMDRVPVMKIIFNYIDNVLTSGNIPLKTSEFLIIVLTIMLGALSVHVILTLQFGLSSVLVVLLSLVFPFFGLRIYGWQRQRKLKKQLRLAISLLANNLDAGNSFTQSIRLVTADLLTPLRTEFETLLQENQLGIPLEKALFHMQQRIPCKELKTLVRGVLLQQETGSDLVYILRTIHKTLQDRAELKNKINVLTAQGKLSGVICVLIPVALFFFLHHFQPEYTRFLLDTPTGNKMLGACVALMTIGGLIIYKIVAFKF